MSHLDDESPCLHYEHVVREDGHVDVRIVLNRSFASPKLPHVVASGQLAGWQYIVLIGNHAYHMATQGVGPSFGVPTDDTRGAARYLMGLTQMAAGMCDVLEKENAS